MSVYARKATFLLGYLEVRFNRVSKLDKNAEVSVWASEFSKFTTDQLADENMKAAVDLHVELQQGKKVFPPTVDEFAACLRKVTYHEPVALEHYEPNWFELFDESDNKGKFTFFVGRKVPSLVMVHAREWFQEHTSFNEQDIESIIRGELPN